MGRVIPIARVVKKRQLAEKLLDGCQHGCQQVHTVVIEHDPAAPRTVKLTMYDIAEVVEIEEEFEGEKGSVSLTLDELALIAYIALPAEVRIGIVGVHGAGKTTLARALAKALRLPLIEEVARQVIEEWGRHPLELGLRERLRFQQAILARQIAEELLHPNGFVSDRTVYDNLAYWYWGGLDRLYPRDFRQAWLKVWQHPGYDLLFYLPIEFPVENDGVRYTCENCRNLLDVILREILLRRDYVTVAGSREERVRRALEAVRGKMEEKDGGRMTGCST